MKKALLAIVAIVAVTGGSYAGTLYWDADGSSTGNSASTGAGLGGTQSWNTTSTSWWSGSGSDVVWTEGSDAVFWGTAGTVTLSGPRTANSLNFKTAGYTVTASTLTMNSGTTITVPSGTTTLASVFAGKNYTVAGGGILYLNNAGNSSVSPITLNGSTLRVSSGSCIGSSGAANVISFLGGTLENDDTGAGNTFANYTMTMGTGGGTLHTPTSSQILFCPVIINGAGSLTKTGSGEIRMILTTGNSFTGGLILSGGIVTASTSTTLGINTMFGAIPSSTMANAITIQNGAELRLAGGQDISLDAKQGITLGTGGGCIDAVGGRTFTIPSVITGSGQLTINGSLNGSDIGQVTLSGANSYTGGTKINGIGTLSVNSIADTGTSAIGNSGTLTFAGGVLSYTGTGAATTGRALSVTANSTIGLPAGGLTLNGAINGGGFCITKTGTGMLVLGGTADNVSLWLTNSGGTVVLNKTSSATVHAVGGNSTVNSGATLQLSGTGGDQIWDGSGVTVASGGAFDLNGQSETITSLTLSGTGISSGGGLVNSSASTTSTLTCSSGITLGANSSMGGAGSIALPSAISGAFALTKVGAGALTLSGANTYSGGTTLGSSSGTLNMNSATAIGTGALTVSGNATIDNTSSGAITLANNNALTLSGGSLTFTGSKDLNFGTGTVTISGASRTLTLNGGTLTLGGGVTDSGGARKLTKTGAGTLVMNGAAGTWSGGCEVDAGTLAIGSDTALGTGAFTLHGGTIQSSGGARSLGNATVLSVNNGTVGGSAAFTFNSSGTFTASGAARTLTVNNSAGTTLAGNVYLSDDNTTSGRGLTINGTGNVGVTAPVANNNAGNTMAASLTYSGSGTLTLSAVNTYSGNTTISGGTLALAGSGSLNGSPNIIDNATFDVSGVTGVPYSLASGQTLSGSGNVKGQLTVPSGASVAPGTASVIGTLSFNGNLTLAGTTSLKINKTAAAADKLVMSSGTVTLGGTLTVVNLAGTLALGDTFDLVDGPIAGSFGNPTLPTLAPGLKWDMSQLGPGGNGTIKVVCDGSLVANAGANQATCAGVGVAIGGNPTASGGSGGSYTYSWSPTTGLSDPTLANPTASPTSTTTYTVTVTDSGGCIALASTTVSVDVLPAITTQPAGQTGCSGSPATFSVSASGPGLSYSWAKHANGGWGSAWSVSGGGSTFRASATDNNLGDPACPSFSAAFDVNSASGNALGMWGGLSGDEVAVRGFNALSVSQVVSVDFDNGNVDTGSRVGFSLQTAGGADVLQFYFLGGAATYKYNDGAEQDTGIPFQRTGLRVQFVLTSASAYKLIVTPCGGSATSFTGAYSGTIVQLKLFNQNTTSGSDKNIYFNNFIVGGYVDNADNYSGDFAGQDKGDQPVSTGNGGSTYTTPALTMADNGSQYEVVVSGCGGAVLSSAATLTVNPAPTADAGPNQAVCSSSPTATLAGVVGGGATGGTWSGGTGTFTPDANTLNAQYTLSAAEIAAGGVTLTLTSIGQLAPCTPVAAHMTITINPAATASAGADQTVCSSTPTVTLAGAIAGGATGGTWSGGTGTFTPDANTLNAQYTPSAAEIAAGGVTLTLTTTGQLAPCAAATSQMTIHVDAAPVGGTATPAAAGVCPSNSGTNITLSGFAGTLQKWQSSADGGSTWVDIASTANPLLTGPLGTSTQFRAVVQNGVCAPANSSVATVTVSDATAPVVVAGSIAACYTNQAAAEAAALAATSASDNCDPHPLLTVATAGGCDATITVTATDASGNQASVQYNTHIVSPPVFGAITATEASANVKDCASTTVQGRVNIAVPVNSSCALAGGRPTVLLVNGAAGETPVFDGESPVGTFNYHWDVTALTSNGTWTVTVTAADICQSVNAQFLLCMNNAQISGQVQLEGFVGTGTEPAHTRAVTFVATDGPGAGAAVLKTWTLVLTNLSGDTFAYTLSDAPRATRGLSAVTAWNLRSKVPVALDANGQATAVNFTGSKLLRGGDFDGNNLTTFDDYSLLGKDFFSFNPVPDITGDGQVDFDDYAIFAANWQLMGDPQ